MRGRPVINEIPKQRCLLATFCLPLALGACATPARMHDEAQLNTVATGCGMALGELIQDAEQKKLLIALRNTVSPKQRVCVTQWARRNGLRPVFVNMTFPEG